MAQATNHYPRTPCTGNPSTVVRSTQSNRNEAERGLSLSPWSHVQDDAAGAQQENYDNSGIESRNGDKKACNKPSNGAVEVGAVMGPVSWPALSQSTRASPKPYFDYLKTLTEGSVAGLASSSQKQVLTNDTNPSLGPNYVAPTRQKSMQWDSESSIIAANGGFHELMAPPGQVTEMSFDNTELPRSSVPETYLQSLNGQWGGFGSQSRSGKDHSQQWNSYQRGNGTPHPRSDGSYHQNLGGRGSVNHDKNSHRTFNDRDNQMQPQKVLSRGFVPHPLHTATPFLPPPPIPVRPFGNPMIYAGPVPISPADSLIGMPIVTPMPPLALFFPPLDSLLHAKIVMQINYYFSMENLISDIFLRQNMNEDGWVPIELIAGFKKVTLLTNNIPLILDALRTSDVVEVQNGKVRKRDDWRRWIIPPSFKFHDI